jgi:CelD/BcsL family acetyltransferase involved in cellulose biosynthesis
MTPSHVLASAVELAAIEEEWRELSAAQPALSYFATPDWVLSWAEVFGAKSAIRVAVYRDSNGRLEAVVPLGRQRHRLHPRIPLDVTVWSNLGSGVGAADHCGFAVAASRVGDVRHWLSCQATRHSLLLSNLDEETGTPLVPADTRPVRTIKCPRLHIPDDPDKIGGSGKFRKQLRAYRRKVERLGITFRWLGPAVVDYRVLDTVFALHQRRGQAAGWSSTFTRDKADFHVRLVRRGHVGRGPAVVLAERDGDPVGALYGFRSRDVFAFYQTGWRPELSETNLATVLVAEAIRFAGVDGATIFDFLRGSEPYKYRFGAVDRVDETWLIPAGVSGLALRGKFHVRG